MAERTLVHPARGQRRGRLAHGGCAGCLSAPARSDPAPGLPRRNQPPPAGRHASGAPRGARARGAPRSGVRARRGLNCFLVTVPFQGWRQVRVSTQRTRVNWAHCVRALGDVQFPDAPAIVLVMDQLNTHSPASLYTAFPPAAAKRIADRLDIHDTPKHGSWVTMAEREVSVRQRQCLRQRFADRTTMEHAVRAWVDNRNATTRRIDWHFTTADARTKRKRLYPAYED